MMKAIRSMRADIKALSLIYAANGIVALSTSANQANSWATGPSSSMQWPASRMHHHRLAIVAPASSISLPR